MTEVAGTAMHKAEMEAARLTLGDLAHPPLPPPNEPAAEAPKKGAGRPRGTSKKKAAPKEKEERMSELAQQAAAAGAPAQGLGVGLQPGIVSSGQVTGTQPPAAAGGFSFGGGAAAAPPAMAPANQDFTSQNGLQATPGISIDFSEIQKQIIGLQGEIHQAFKDAAEASAERELDIKQTVEKQFGILNQRITQHSEILQEMLTFLKQGGTTAAPPSTSAPTTPPANNGVAPAAPPAWPHKFSEQKANPNMNDFIPPACWDELLIEGVWPKGPAPLMPVCEQLVAQLKAAKNVELTVDQIGESFMARGFADPQKLVTLPLEDLRMRNLIK